MVRRYFKEHFFQISKITRDSVGGQYTDFSILRRYYTLFYHSLVLSIYKQMCNFAVINNDFQGLK